MIEAGSVLLGYVTGRLLGSGTFGEVYLAKDIKNGELVAIKVESIKSTKKCLEHEFKVLARLQSSVLFPKLGIFGKSPVFCFYSMEMLGLSIYEISKKLPERKVPMESGVTIMTETLKALEQMHTFGLIHRDIKPGNIITRNKKDYPICLIDFGLTIQYLDTATGKHLPKREHVGFRGSKAYASVNAHTGCTLSRKDDLISWYYVMIELLCGKLPWRGVRDHQELIVLKSLFNVKKFVQSTAPELNDIWTSINYLSFEEKPDYKFIYEKINSMKERLKITGNEPKVWDQYFASNIFKDESFWQLRVIEDVSETPIDAHIIEDDVSEQYASDEDKSSCRI